MEQGPQALVADVVDHPLGEKEFGQFGQAPGRERLCVVGRRRDGDLLDLTALGQAEGLRPASRVPRVQAVESVLIEVVDHIPHPVRAGERYLGDLQHRHALRREQDHLRPPPGHHRTGSPADNPQQPPALAVIDLPDTHVLSHTTGLTGHVTTGQALPDAALA